MLGLVLLITVPVGILFGGAMFAYCTANKSKDTKRTIKEESPTKGNYTFICIWDDELENTQGE